MKELQIERFVAPFFVQVICKHFGAVLGAFGAICGRDFFFCRSSIFLFRSLLKVFCLFPFLALALSCPLKIEVRIMAISDKTRKMLWAKSGNRCSICKIELFSNEVGKETLNVGEECHIISSQKSGPRHKDGILDYDDYDNLILLCRNHHKEIDELTVTYSEEVIRYLKQNHENWVNSTLNSSTKSKNQTQPRFISRITSGKELLNILADSHAYETDYEEVETEAEADFIGGVLQDLVDYGELCGMVEAYERVKMGLSLSETLKRLEENGYFLFAEKKIERNNWAVATILIRKKDNPEIIKLEL